MRVEILGHSSVLVEMGASRILVDPVFADAFGSDTLVVYPPRTLDADALVRATTLLAVTHIHLDHFHPPTLARFPKNLPVVVPPHDALVNAVRSLGFRNVVALEPWARHALDGGTLLATPSQFEIEEFGLVAYDETGSYWHMSDAIVTEAVGERVRESVGPVSALSVKHQPLRTLIGYQRGLQSTMMDRDDLVGAFECAFAADPAYVFPYYSGFAFHPERAWANRHIAPYDAAEIVRLFKRRLGERAAVEVVVPGDVLDVRGRRVTRLPAAGPHAVATPPGERAQWEPIDPSTLKGLHDPGDRVWLAEALPKLLKNEVMPWVLAHIEQRTGLFGAYIELQTVWQCIVHAGDGVRLQHAVDFRCEPPRLHLDRAHPDANVFSHIGGSDLAQVLRGEAGPEVFWMAGGYRMYEKILLVRDDRIAAPPMEGWDLYERLPDPVTHFLRKVGVRRK